MSKLWSTGCFAAKKNWAKSLRIISCSHRNISWNKWSTFMARICIYFYITLWVGSCFKYLFWKNSPAVSGKTLLVEKLDSVWVRPPWWGSDKIRPSCPALPISGWHIPTWCRVMHWNIFRMLYFLPLKITFPKKFSKAPFQTIFFPVTRCHSSHGEYINIPHINIESENILINYIQ